MPPLDGTLLSPTTDVRVMSLRQSTIGLDRTTVLVGLFLLLVTPYFVLIEGAVVEWFWFVLLVVGVVLLYRLVVGIERIASATERVADESGRP